MKKLLSGTLCLLTLAFICILWSCNPLLTPLPQSGEEDRPGYSGQGGIPTGIVYFPEGSDTGTLSLTVVEPVETTRSVVSTGSTTGGRALVGAGADDIKSGDGLRTLFQLIAIDMAEKTKIWDFDQVEFSTGQSSCVLKMTVQKNHNYLILVLSGHKGMAAEGNTLLASGYTMQTMIPGKVVTIQMTPVIVDAKVVYGDPGTGGIVEAPAGQTSVVQTSSSAWTAQFRVGSRTETIGGTEKVSGDGLEALRFVEHALANSGASEWWGDGPFTAVSSSVAFTGRVNGGATSVITAVDNGSDPFTADTSDGVHLSAAIGEPIADLVLSDIDTNTIYSFDGSVQLNIGYRPFGKSAASWSDFTDFQTPLASASDSDIPLWVIRNGLNDSEQTTGTGFDGFDGSDTNGGVPVSYETPPGFTVRGKTVIYNEPQAYRLWTNMYVQENLLAHFDAINNTGSGHTTNLSDGWQDLVGTYFGNGGKAILGADENRIAIPGADGIVWGNTYLDIQKVQASVKYPLIWGSRAGVFDTTKTIELGNTKSGNRLVWFGMAYQFFDTELEGALNYWSGAYGGTDLPSGYIAEPGKFLTRSLSVVKDFWNDLYINGSDKFTSPKSFLDPISSYQQTYYYSYHDPYGTSKPSKLSCFRLYDGQLSAEQRQRNAFLDNYRFNNPDGTKPAPTISLYQNDIVVASEQNLAIVDAGNETTLSFTTNSLVAGDTYEVKVMNGGTVIKSLGTFTVPASPGDNDPTLIVGTSWPVRDFAYTGRAQEWIVPKTGNYKLEVWGAQGGDDGSGYGGLGGYSQGIIALIAGDRLDIFIGENHDTKGGGSFNGGGIGWSENPIGGGYNGGGATDIRWPTPYTINGNPASDSRIIVAGGGGGYGGNNRNGGYGGGLTGGIGEQGARQAGGGTQITGGAAGGVPTPSGEIPVVATGGNAGIGGNGGANNGAGGGGGWFGGGGNADNPFDVGSAAGGSGYVSALLSDAEMIAGNSDRYTFPNNVSSYYATTAIDTATDYSFTAGSATPTMPDWHDPTGAAKVIGNEGHGYARITWVGPSWPVRDFAYTGRAQEWIVPKTGKYKLEVWGAQGGGNTAAAYLPGGPGGYSRGTVSLNQGERLYVYVGQFGGNTLSTSGGFNGGGDSKTHAYPGGGGTDIRLVQTDTYTAAKRLIVAGGGGGGSHFGTVSGTSPYGYGGGTEGGSGGSTFYQLSITMTQATGGTQDSGGEGSIASDNMYGTGGAGSFGLGGNGDNINHEPETSNIFGGGGGGGWYGGGGGSAGNYIVAGGGGGSGYVFTSTSKANYPAGAAIPADRYFLTDPALLSGNEQIPDPHDPTGTTEVPGNTGHGYARIRWVGP